METKTVKKNNRGNNRSETRKKKGAVAGSASGRWCPRNPGEHALFKRLGSLLWEAISLQGVNCVAHELGLSVWLRMNDEAR